MPSVLEFQKGMQTWHSTLMEEVAIARFNASPEMTGYWFKDVNSWQAKEKTALTSTFNFSIQWEWTLLAKDETVLQNSKFNQKK